MIGLIEKGQIIMDDRTEKAERALLQEVVTILTIPTMAVSENEIIAKHQYE